jgi:hypothetical protein
MAEGNNDDFIFDIPGNDLMDSKGDDDAILSIQKESYGSFLPVDWKNRKRRDKEKKEEMPRRRVERAYK